MRARTLEVDLARVVELCRGAPVRRRAVPPPPSTATRLERARHELSRVQRAELALLLRRAVAARLAGEARDETALAQGLLEVLALAAAEGWRWPRSLERLVRRLIEQPCAGWPSALRLARSAQAVAPTLAGRVLLAEALESSGAPRAALAELTGALLRLPPAARPARLLAALERLLGRALRPGDDPRLARACARLARGLAAERAA